METRNVTLTLEKAKEFYNSGNAALKEVALQAFTEEELKTPKFTNIKTFWQAVEALGLHTRDVKIDLEELDGHIFEAHTAKQLKTIYKLDIIRKALNDDWKPSLVKGSVYYPYVRICPAGQEAREAVSNNNLKLSESFKADGQKYTLVSGGCSYYDSYGLANSGYRFGEVQPYLGLLGCKSREIAEHMSRYFSKEIFEATYAQHIGMYEWV